MSSVPRPTSNFRKFSPGSCRAGFHLPQYLAQNDRSSLSDRRRGQRVFAAISPGARGGEARPRPALPAASAHLCRIARRRNGQEILRGFLELALPGSSAIHYQEGEDPAAAILEAARRNESIYSWLAPWKEVVLRPFLGNVARTLVQDRLFRDPFHQTRGAEAVLSNCFPGRLLLTTGALPAQGAPSGRSRECENSASFAFTTFDEARAKARTDARKAGAKGRARWMRGDRARKFIDSAGPNDVPIERAAFAAIPDMPRSISSSRSTRPCSRCGRSRGLRRWFAGARRLGHGRDSLQSLGNPIG